MSSIIIFSIFLILPFLLGFFHARINKTLPAAVLFYRYFLSFNMVLGTVFVALRMILDGQREAHLAGWEFSPIYYQYGIALLSMALMAVFTLFSRTKLHLAPGILWGFFLALSVIGNFIEGLEHTVVMDDVMRIHLVYTFISFLITIYFVWLLSSLSPNESASG